MIRASVEDNRATPDRTPAPTAEEADAMLAAALRTSDAGQAWASAAAVPSAAGP
jgi:hypothetical protein